LVPFLSGTARPRFSRSSALFESILQPEEPLNRRKLRGYFGRRVLWDENGQNRGCYLAAATSQHLDLPVANANRSEKTALAEPSSYDPQAEKQAAAQAGAKIFSCVFTSRFFYQPHKLDHPVRMSTYCLRVSRIV